MFKRIVLVSLLFVTILQAGELEKIFAKNGVNGALIIASLKSNEFFIHNEKRADKRFSPASTFKIPHTLIALQESFVKDKNDIIKWDGVKRSYAPWNKDQTLSCAIAVSCVWCYKTFTTKISRNKYEEYLRKFNYGNKTIGADKSSFWLDGSLKISTYEQIDFLKKLYSYNLAISKKNIDILKDIITIDKNAQYTLKAKSGWSGKIGWYIGYIKTNGKVWFFALNADITKEQLPLRKKIVLYSFKAKGLI